MRAVMLLPSFITGLLLVLASFAGNVESEEVEEDKTVGYGIGREQWRGEVNLLSWAPRVYHLKGFLSDFECDHLKELGKPTLHASSVVDHDTGKPKPSNARTSQGTFLARGMDDVVSRVEERVAQVTMLPVSHQESMQILRYQQGEKYSPHHDFFHHETHTSVSAGGQRIMTVLMYIETPLEGGETVFPRADRRSSGPGWSACARAGMSVKPIKGDAVMFYSLFPNGTADASSLHGSCPTLQGEKWSATKWIRVWSRDVQSVPLLLRNRKELRDRVV
ncbi:hypothetical protein BSKO_00293 [Bryopsis sp. KO-2023]|nr:hypothetical protein BSKO_00293 [Bryopsis sp. KO-2023]